MRVCCAQELEKKFQQTAAYRNMKEILTKKNEQIKEIRKRLQRWDDDCEIIQIQEVKMNQHLWK